jgi:hypothetical protein
MRGRKNKRWTKKQISMPTFEKIEGRVGRMREGVLLIVGRGYQQ